MLIFNILDLFHNFRAQISFKLGFTIIYSIVDFVDFVEDDSKKREKKIKDAVHNLFSFLEGKTLC